MAVLVPALLMAFLLDALRDPTRRAERLRAHRAYLAGRLGRLRRARGRRPRRARRSPATTAASSGCARRWTGSSPRAACSCWSWSPSAGFAPVLLAAGAACSRRAWRDDRTGPLLAVFWPAALATVAPERLLPRRLPAGALGDRPLRHLRGAARADPDDGPDRASGAAVADRADRRGAALADAARAARGADDRRGARDLGHQLPHGPCPRTWHRRPG